MMWNYGFGGFDWLWMSLMMVLFWGGIIALGVWAIRSLIGPRRGPGPALDVLRRRLARGEINQDEFERLRKALGA